MITASDAKTITQQALLESKRQKEKLEEDILKNHNIRIREKDNPKTLKHVEKKVREAAVKGASEVEAFSFSVKRGELLIGDGPVTEANLKYDAHRELLAQLREAGYEVGLVVGGPPAGYGKVEWYNVLLKW
jgi:SepF-like predicted cell division protein (DUF552 family)